MLPASYQVPAAIIFVAGGLLACFLGYRIFRIVLGIYGFILGALAATSIVAPVETTATLVTALVGGAIGAAVLYFAYFIGVAFAGAALAALLVHVAWRHFFQGEPHALAIVAACVAGALASVSLQRYVIILSSAFGGAWTLIVGGLALYGQPAAAEAATKGDVWMTYPLNPAPGHAWTLIAWLV
ncbi:MAG: DUF4203 domain-containing protein, partial [Vicinamibacteraceae bacterium]|nr:DUF4203 domain-containing protein [Vicinamibacteraceae bacterium]